MATTQDPGRGPAIPRWEGSSKWPACCAVFIAIGLSSFSFLLLNSALLSPTQPLPDTSATLGGTARTQGKPSNLVFFFFSPAELEH